MANVCAQSAFYELAEGWYQGRPLSNMITTRSKGHHTHLRRNAMHAYTMATAMSLEDTLDPSIEQLLLSLKEQCREGKKAIDVASWLMYFAFDAIGRLNFSEDLGYLATGSDIEGRITGTALVLTYLSVVGQAPWLHKFMFGSATLQRLLNLEQTNSIQNVSHSSTSHPIYHLWFAAACNRHGQETHRERRAERA